MKSPFQTAFEKMTDEELKHLSDFASDRSKGTAARLWVIESQLELEQRQRGILTKPKATNAITHPEKFQAEMVLHLRSNQAAHVQIVKGKKTAVAKLDDENYSQTVRAHFGVNDFYGDEACKAVRELDEAFFKSALAAVKDLKSSNRKAGESRMLLHIEAALTILSKRKNPLEKMTKQQMEKNLAKPLGNNIFADRNSWQAFFKRPEIKPFVTQARGK